MISAKTKLGLAVMLSVAGFVLSKPSQVAEAQLPSGGSNRQLVGKECGRCGSSVPLSARVGQYCPNCQAYWGSERERLVDAAPQQNSRGPGAPTITKGKQPKAKSQESQDNRVRSPGGKFSAEKSSDGAYVRIFNEAGCHILTLPHAAELRAEMFSCADDAVVTVDSGGGCSVYELPVGVRRFRLSENRTCAAVFVPSRDGEVMICKPQVIYFKDAATNRLVDGRIPASRRSAFAEVILTSDNYGTRLFTREVDGRTNAWAVTGQRLAPGTYKNVAEQAPEDGRTVIARLAF